MHGVVARSTFASQNVQKLKASDHFWKFRCRKSARRCGAKHIRKSKCEKIEGFGALLGIKTSKKCTALWREAHLEVKICRFTWQAQGIRHLVERQQKVAKREGFHTFHKTMAGVLHLKRICNDAFFVAGAVQETCSSELLGAPGADFLRGVALWNIRSSGLLR